MSTDNTPYRVVDSELLLDAPIIGVRRDTITTATGEAKREIVEHFSAVAVAAVRDNHVMMIRQYRHGVGRHLWEIPAGLLDLVGEDPLEAARRELAEEAGLRAHSWHLLGDVVTSPGFSEEMCRIYLAEDLDDDLSDFDLPEAEFEEAEIETRWVPIPEAIEWAQTGVVENSIATIALLHLAAGTRRDVSEPFNYHSGLAERRSARAEAKPGTDMKFLR
ncbi:NUDIX domain-containing protein [Corynebacterium macclintockiae]|uniref:NUDIX domain-containing protein n=1 Tax=Corynebacterium macclintockiae TaxID=2913501 RepID=UPI003EBC80B0